MRSERAFQAFLLALVASPGLASAAALIVSFTFQVDAIAAQEHLGGFAHLFPPCSGCGLCGMSRAFSAFSHGHWDAALRLNGAVVVLWPMAWLMCFVSLFGVYRLWRQPVQFFVAPTRGAQGAIK